MTMSQNTSLTTAITTTPQPTWQGAPSAPFKSIFLTFRRTNIMHLTKRLTTILLCALLCSPIAPAQDRKDDSQANNSNAPAPPTSEDVTIIIQRQQVRFTGRTAAEEMRLQ